MICPFVVKAVAEIGYVRGKPYSSVIASVRLAT